MMFRVAVKFFAGVFGALCATGWLGPCAIADLCNVTQSDIAISCVNIFENIFEKQKEATVVRLADLPD